MVRPTDFEVANLGSIWSFAPRTPAAAEHLVNVLAEAEADGEAPMRGGSAVMIDARLAPDWVLRLRRDGFVVGPA